MPMTVERRLEKLSGVLSPTQAVLAWLTEAQQHGSLLEYCATLKDAPESAFPLVRLQTQLEQAVLGKTREVLRRSLNTKVRGQLLLAYRDVGMLYFLSINLNGWVREQHRANWLHVALVATMLRAALDAEDEQGLIPGWEQAQEAMRTAYVQADVVQVIAERYFGGQSPLFPEAAEDVASLVEHTERVAGRWNDLMRILATPGPPSRKRKAAVPIRQVDPRLAPVDFAEVRAAVRPVVLREAALQVVLAKAEAWELIGEREKGTSLVPPLLSHAAG